MKKHRYGVSFHYKMTDGDINADTIVIDSDALLDQHEDGIKIKRAVIAHLYEKHPAKRKSNTILIDIFSFRKVF